MDMQLSSAFVAGTKLNNDEGLIDIESLTRQITSPPMFALTDHMDIAITELHQLVKGFSGNLWRLQFSNGLGIECVESTLIFDGKLKWRTARSLRPDDPVIGVVVEEGNNHGELFHVTKSERVRSSLQTPVYYFVTRHHNLLLPYYGEEGTKYAGKLTFICTHQ